MISSQLKFTLLGYGKMGKLVEKVVPERGHRVVSIRKSKGQPVNLDDCDLIIDFSTANSVLENVEEAGISNKNIVIGTTGWDDKIPQVKMLAEKYQIGVLFSPNFSIGVHLFIQLAQDAGLLFGKGQAYSAAGVEIHHQEKLDAPSGTAKAIHNAVTRSGMHMPEFASVRVGKVPGTHTLYFDSEEDTITLTHTAKGREGFARGAVRAAEWLKNKKGFFTLEDLL